MPLRAPVLAAEASEEKEEAEDAMDEDEPDETPQLMDQDSQGSYVYEVYSLLPHLTSRLAFCLLPLDLRHPARHRSSPGARSLCVCLSGRPPIGRGGRRRVPCARWLGAAREQCVKLRVRRG